MGPSGFQTKGLEYRDVVVASLFSLLTLWDVVFYKDANHLLWGTIS